MVLVQRWSLAQVECIVNYVLLFKENKYTYRTITIKHFRVISCTIFILKPRFSIVAFPAAFLHTNSGSLLTSTEGTPFSPLRFLQVFCTKKFLLYFSKYSRHIPTGNIVFELFSHYTVHVHHSVVLALKNKINIRQVQTRRIGVTSCKNVCKIIC